jgi:hypothetical protein
MKVGDLVRSIDPALGPEGRALQTTLVEHEWRGIIIGWDGLEPIVFWNERFPSELEYKEQLEVISENR